MTIIEYPRDEGAFIRLGALVTLTVGTMCMFGVDYRGRTSLFGYDDVVFTIVVAVGPFELTFTKLDRSKIAP